MIEPSFIRVMLFRITIPLLCSTDPLLFQATIMKQITLSDLKQQSEAAANAPRLRAHRNFHPELSDPVQRLAIAMELAPMFALIVIRIPLSCYFPFTGVLSC